MKMNSKIIKLLFAAVLSVHAGISVSAEEVEGKDIWSVVFDGSGTLISNVEREEEFTETLNHIQPGDYVYLSVSIKNTSDKETDWYMKNEVLNSFERSVEASGGAYSYQLSYHDMNGEERVIYDSDTVGGDEIVNNLEGLEQATNSLNDYFYLITLAEKEEGKVTLRVGLDGETNGNAYQNAAADLEMIFAVEYSASAFPSEPKQEIRTETKYVTVKKEKTSSVNTGDESKTIIFACAAGAGLAGLLVLLTVKKRKEK